MPELSLDALPEPERSELLAAKAMLDHYTQIIAFEWMAKPEEEK